MMATSKVSVVLKWIIDALLLAIIIVAIWLLDHIPEPFHRGFFCDDDTIRYPYKPDNIISKETDTISELLAVVVILTVNLYLKYARKRTFCFSNFLIILNDIFVFNFGFFASYFTCCVLKLTVGRLRPTFLNMCFNDTAEIQALCPNGNEHYYVEDFVCTNTDFDLTDARMSFPSGHSTTTVFSMAFLTIYLVKLINIKELRVKFLVPFIQLGFVSFAVYISMTRSADYKHHWEDIVAGAIIGICFALFCGFQLLKDRLKEEISRPLLYKDTKSYHSIGE